MLINPVCYTCGKAVSAYYEAYLAIKESRLRELTKKHPSKVIPHMISTTNDLQVEMGDVLDKMKIHACAAAV